jgi:type IV pilus assembly protein PilX
MNHSTATSWLRRRTELGSERGAALIMSLVILLILTVLGITAMGTSSLEQKMAGNTQEANRAFQAAESGLNQALNTAGTLDLNKSQKTNATFSGMSASAAVETRFIQFSPAKRGSGYGNNFEAANFEQDGEGKTTAGAKANIHRGIAQIVPKAN